MGAAIVLLAFSGIGLLRPVEDVSYTVLSPIETGLRGARAKDAVAKLLEASIGSP